MIFVDIFTALLIVLVLVLLVTQVLIPALCGTKLFPFFRHSAEVIESRRQRNELAEEADALTELVANMSSVNANTERLVKLQEQRDRLTKEIEKLKKHPTQEDQNESN